MKQKKGIDCDIVIPNDKPFHKSRMSNFYAFLKTYKKLRKIILINNANSCYEIKLFMVS